jgi:CheY-like chemotaxis protein
MDEFVSSSIRCRAAYVVGPRALFVLHYSRKPDPAQRKERDMAEAKKTVVCIEDEPEMIDLIRLILERRGIEVVGALTGREGLETVRRVKPSLILLDLMLPDMDGWEVYRQIKADPELKDIPIITTPTTKYQSIDDVIKRYLS